MLAIVSPALASIKKNTTDADLKLFSNNLFGTKSSLFKLSVLNRQEEIKLKIDLASDILDVTGFPMEIKKGENPIDNVNEYLKLK